MFSRSLPLPFLLLAITPLAAQELPKPQAEHLKLSQSVGTWDAAIESVGLDGKWHRSKGVSVQKMGPGDYWIIDDFHGEMNGLPFTGHGALGYDPLRQAYVQSWISVTPMLMVFTGTFDQAGKVLTMTGEGPGMDGTPIKMKNVTTWVSTDSMTLEVFVVMPDGNETKNMTITYTRRPDKQADHASANKQQRPVDCPDRGYTHMKFIVFGHANKDTEAGVLPTSEEFVEMGKFIEELVKAGVFVAGEGLQPSAKGARITFGKDGKTSIKNGPFTESKELIAGFSIIQVKSLDEAIAWMSRMPSQKGGSLEIRQLFSDEDFAQVDPTGELRERDAQLREQAATQHGKR